MPQPAGLQEAKLQDLWLLQSCPQPCYKPSWPTLQLGNRPAWSSGLELRTRAPLSPCFYDTSITDARTTEEGEKDQVHISALSCWLRTTIPTTIPHLLGLPWQLKAHLSPSWTTSVGSHFTPWPQWALGVSQQEPTVRGSCLWKSLNSQKQSQIRTAF